VLVALVLGQRWKETTLGPKVIQVLTIGQKMSAFESQQKSYANN
jgi:hypothetical protein